MWDKLYINAHAATMTDDQLGIIDDSALGVTDGKIVFIDKLRNLPTKPEHCAHEVHDCQGRWLTPGLIDCHTHLVYAGNRNHDFRLRLQGKSYVEIAASGGGIFSTVQATRNCSEEELYSQSEPRLQYMLKQGVTTVEIKSGYGLDLATELKMLRVARQLGENYPVTIKTTFLGAHTIPKEFAGNSEKYIDYVCQEMLPQVAELGLADAVDSFCEHIAFTPNQISKVFTAAQQLKLAVKIHAEQLSHHGGIALASQFKALSADHCEFATVTDVAAMAAANMVAVLLPGAFYTLRETQRPPLQLFRDYKVPIAIATDCNPGSSPTCNLPLMLNMATILFGLTAEEAWLAVTKHAAAALGIAADTGSLQVGKFADFVMWDFSHPIDLAAGFGQPIARQTIWHGQLGAQHDIHA